MKIRIVLFTIFLGTGILFAQDWQTDLTKAKEISKAGNKPIILVFQGSDWCAPCIKLDRKIWSSEEFQNYAADHFVIGSRQNKKIKMRNWRKPIIAMDTFLWLLFWMRMVKYWDKQDIKIYR